MLHVAPNYPNWRVTGHRQVGCPTTRPMRRPGQRRARIDPGSRAHEPARFRAGQRFAARAQYADMRGAVDLGSAGAHDRAAADIRSARSDARARGRDETGTAA